MEVSGSSLIMTHRQLRVEDHVVRLDQLDFHGSLSERKSARQVPQVYEVHTCALIDPRLPVCSTCVDERAARGRRDGQTDTRRSGSPNLRVEAKYQELGSV